MGMNQTPASERVHISFFGKRNAGKSSVINAITGQDLAIVSSVRGTTTDPVYKTMELLPLGPVMIKMCIRDSHMIQKVLQLVLPKEMKNFSKL